MALRQQKRGGGQSRWKLAEVQAGLQHFYKEHGRYPTAAEIDAYSYLPSTRSIERSFGGLVPMRKTLKLAGNHDFRAGEHSSKRAHMILARAHTTEAEVYAFLCKRFGREFVHREYLFTDDHRTRADFFVYDTEKGFCVDVFYPASRRNLSGCLNIKLKKFRNVTTHMPYPIIYLQMNPDITMHTISAILERKTQPLPKGQDLMCWNAFKEFCNKRKPLQVTAWGQGKTKHRPKA